MNRDRNDTRRHDRRSNFRFSLRQRHAELLRQFADNLVVQLRAVALFKHRKRRLLATDFGGKYALRQLRSAASIPDFETDTWTESCHGGYYGLYLINLQGVKYQQYKHIYQHINNNINTC